MQRVDLVFHLHQHFTVIVPWAPVVDLILDVINLLGSLIITR